jgi:hypothetical protein
MTDMNSPQSVVQQQTTTDPNTQFPEQQQTMDKSNAEFVDQQIPTALMRPQFRQQHSSWLDSMEAHSVGKFMGFPVNLTVLLVDHFSFLWAQTMGNSPQNSLGVADRRNSLPGRPSPKGPLDTVGCSNSRVRILISSSIPPSQRSASRDSLNILVNMLSMVCPNNNNIHRGRLDTEERHWFVVSPRMEL